MNEGVFNMKIRKFLKKVGIQSQCEIEQSVKQSIEKDELNGIEKLEVSILPASTFNSTESNNWWCNQVGVIFIYNNIHDCYKMRLLEKYINLINNYFQ